MQEVEQEKNSLMFYMYWEGTQKSFMILREWSVTAAAAERRLGGTVFETAQDLLLADVAVSHQQELEQIVVLFLLTRLRRVGLTRSHNIRLSQTLSILQATNGATKLTLPLSHFPPYSRHADGSSFTSFTTCTAVVTSTATSSGTWPVKAIASYRGAQVRRVDSLMDLDREISNDQRRSWGPSYLRDQDTDLRQRERVS